MISMEDDSSNVLNDHKQESDIANEGNSNNGAEENAPDSDTIKMFVGQIPKTWDETKLKEFFQQYGPVYHLNVLRDKETENSRGCCFVTFYHRKDAINAQNALHNIFVMPGLSHPVQMKPADIENRNDRKLFVGMLNKTLDEDGIRDLFKEFGQIEDCTILRENGKSKGCAFLTFVNRSCAHQAIRKMNQSQIFEGCTKPVVVKFADAGKDKNVNKKSTEENRAANGEGCAETSNQKPTAVPSAPNGGVDVLTNLVSLLQQPGIANLLESARVLQQLQTPSQPQPIFASTPSASIGPSPTLLAPVPSLNPVPLQQCQTSALSPQQTPKFAQSTPFPAQTSASNLLNFSTPGLLLQQNLVAGINPHAFAATAAQNNNYGFAAYGRSMLAQLSPTTSTTGQSPYGQMMISPTTASALFPPLISASASSSFGASVSSDKSSRGPDGCNLFIYHLPQEFTDADLYATFCNFGSILSAKVFIDKQTNLSKCFGFVSYSDEASAQNAIKGMNGHQIGNKRLKVQVKRSEKPYDKP